MMMMMMGAASGRGRLTVGRSKALPHDGMVLWGDGGRSHDHPAGAR